MFSYAQLMIIMYPIWFVQYYWRQILTIGGAVVGLIYIGYLIGVHHEAQVVKHAIEHLLTT